MNTFRGVSGRHLQGLAEHVGVKDNEVLIFSELMDAKSLFLTANADTIYFLGIIDLTKGPMVLETPPMALGAIDDMWFRWVTDFGLPGPDRGEGGKYLFVPPGYDGQCRRAASSSPEPRTTRVIWFGRSFLENNDPKPVADAIKKTPRSIPTKPAASARASPSSWTARPSSAGSLPPPPTVFHEGSGKAMNTIPPNDFSYFEMLNELVQQEPADVARPRAHGIARRHRHRQGQALRARCADEEDPDRSARGRQRHLAQPVHEPARSELVSTTPARPG